MTAKPASTSIPWASAVYEGVVRHRRHEPHPHAFTYRVAQLYLDLDEVERIFHGRWLWSASHANVAQFRRSDYLGPCDLPLAEAVRRRVEQATGRRPSGPVRLLTHLRYFGLVFNPATSLSWLDYTLDKLDLVLVMSVNPGFGGQSFIPSALDKLREVRRRIDASGRAIRLEIDGGVKPSNIAEIARAGADTFVAGSAIFGEKDYAGVIARMQAEVGSP